MRSDLQDPFQKEFLQVKLSLLKKIQHFRLQLSAGELATYELATYELATWRASTLRACSLRPGQFATRRARTLRAALRSAKASSRLARSWPAIWLTGELAPSELVAGDPASSRDAELETCELVALVHPMDFLLLALKQSNCLRN
ncbi:UNVERIFIED_CONTAM: hypothetical protein Slati_4548000 [Sesamum latifolium]|uniref:Uncharacterized protein n=1 Tax=Sesamum latifolium TaxID=2727402 RepID=A0AAW2S3R0_9LAMI